MRIKMKDSNVEYEGVFITETPSKLTMNVNCEYYNGVPAVTYHLENWITIPKSTFDVVEQLDPAPNRR